MADTKPAAQSTQPPTTSSSGKLAPAAESGDPAVHKLLADIQTAQLNGDSDGEKNLRKQLAELGYE